MKQLAARADDRWKAQPSFLDHPNKQQPQPALQPRDPAGNVGQTEPEEKQGVRNVAGTQEEVQEAVAGKEHDKGRFKGDTKESPWKPKAGGLNQEQEPAPWTPKIARRR